MKKTYLILISIIFGTSIFAQNCTNCDGSQTDSNYSFAAGYLSQASGTRSIAIGTSSFASNVESVSIGSYALSNADGSFAIGRLVETEESASQAMVIGMGVDLDYKLQNKTLNSLAIGFNSTVPTLFISPAPTNVGYTLTGKVSIGNIGDENGIYVPQAKLHIKADQGEVASILIEPNNWESGEYASLQLGNSIHSITSNNIKGIEFNSENNFIFNGINSGFGVEEPKAKVHINGDLLFEHSLNGIIMKSEDGNCWKGTISNTGELVFSQIDCETLSSTDNISVQKHSEVFIYPNPTNGQITVEYTGNRKNLRLEIKSISGLLVATYKISKGENRLELNNISDQIIVASIFTKKGELISINKVVIKK